MNSKDPPLPPHKKVLPQAYLYILQITAGVQETSEAHLKTLNWKSLGCRMISTSNGELSLWIAWNYYLLLLRRFVHFMVFAVVIYWLHGDHAGLEKRPKAARPTAGKASMVWSGRGHDGEEPKGPREREPQELAEGGRTVLHNLSWGFVYWPVLV